LKTPTIAVIAAVVFAGATGAQPAPKARTDKVRTADGVVTVVFAPRATASDIALPLYPGARTESGSCYTVKTSKGKLAKLRATITLHTTHSVSKIVEFYRKALPGGQLRWEKPGTRAALWKKSGDKVWIVRIQPGLIRIKHCASPVPIRLEKPARQKGPVRSASLGTERHVSNA
jgi:hypothetical protein